VGQYYCSQYGNTNGPHLNNVYACKTAVSSGVTPYNHYGYQSFQCFEYAAPYLWTQSGVWAGPGSTVEIQAQGVCGGLAQAVSHVYPQYQLHRPGDGAIPTTGDVISMWGGRSGQGEYGNYSHVAVVVGVKSTTITVIQENPGKMTTITMGPGGWSFGSGYYTQFDWVDTGGGSSGGASTTAGGPGGSAPGANLSSDGGFEAANAWSVMPGTNYVVYSNGQIAGQSAHSGRHFAATNTNTVGGGIYEDIPLSTHSGQLVCGSAWVGAQGGGSGAGGEFVLWLLGGKYNENGVASFSNLGAGWHQEQTCVSASTAHSTLRIQFYPVVNGPATLTIDDVSAS